MHLKINSSQRILSDAYLHVGRLAPGDAPVLFE